MSTKATLNGVPLIGSVINRWRFKEGILPVMETLTVSRDQGKGLIPYDGKPLASTLIVDDGETKPLIVKKLTIVGFLPGEDPWTQKVVVADRRWLWRYPHVLRRFNIRRRGAFQRRGKWNEKLQPTPTQEVTYAVWSLDPKTKKPWEPKRALDSVMMDKDALNIPPSDIVYDKSLGIEFQNLDLENVELDDKGHLAVQRITKAIPGVALFVNENGEVVFFQKNSGFEKAMIDKAGPEIQQGGHIEYITNEEVRPEFVDVYFTVESEVRFDYIESTSRTVATSPFDKRELNNVLPAPDFKLSMPDGRVITQGTWVEFVDFLDSAVVKQGKGLLANLTVEKWFKLIREAFVPELNLWSAMLLTGIVTPNSDEVNWMARVSAIQKHYRQTFRIHQRWLERILSMADYLVGTIDPANGQRAPAMAFSDHAVKNAFKGMIHLARNGQDMRYATNVPGYAANLDNAVPAPATVTITDPDQGVIHVEYQNDPYNLQDKVFPSLLENIPGVSAEDATKGKTSFLHDAVNRKGAKKPSLAEAHKLAVVITCVPASPNNKQQLYKIRVKPSDILNRLPKHMHASLNKVNPGLVEEVRIGAGMETARVRWRDDRSADIEKIFGVRSGTPNFNDLILNDDPSGAVQSVGGGTAASIREIAFSAAAAIYANYHDRYMGSKVVHGKGGLTPAGNLQEVVYEVGTDGKFISNISLPDNPEGLDLFAFMNESTRRIITKNAQASR